VRKTWIVLALVTGLVAACSGSAASGSLQASGTPTSGTPAGGTQAAATATGTAGNSTGGAPKTPVACSLLTANEAATALGVPVNPGAGSVDPAENVCTFGGHTLADMINFVEISVIDPVEFTPTRASVPSVFDISPATGIGDASYYQKDYLPNASGTRMSLSVRKGQTAFRIDMVLYGATDNRLMAAEKTLALGAVGRI
jgi:hypothetical protein